MRQNKFLLLFLLWFTLVPGFIASSPLSSPSWGFALDLPEGYEFAGGDGKDRFSFNGPGEAVFDLIVYGPRGGRAPYPSVEALARDVQTRLQSSGDVSSFEYQSKKTALLELVFDINASSMTGWGLAVELKAQEPDRPGALLLALAYGPARTPELQTLHLSALDSLVPSPEDRLCPGPVTEFGYPRETRRAMPIWGLEEEAWFFEEDEEGAQALIDREFEVLQLYAGGPLWKEAWIRFYRAVYRDSFDRLAGAGFAVERKFNLPPGEDRDFAGRALEWLQSFAYERDFEGSDLINLISAVLEGRGDCDNKSLLWAIILNQANIPAAIMVSREHNHAMALADLPGQGARFEAGGKEWLVAETTVMVPLGLIAQDMSDPKDWIGILFE